MLYLVCTTISHDDHARYEVPEGAQGLGTCIWGPCFNSTLCATWINVICGIGKNTNPMLYSKSRHLTLYQRKVRSKELVMDNCHTGR